MTSSRYVGAIWLLALAPFMVSIPTAAQDRASRFSASADVDVVNLDLLITDRNGNPVGDLTQADFQITEDKKKVSITNFYYVEPSEALPQDALKVIVYVDNFNIRSASRNAALAAMRDFLAKQMSEREIEVMVASCEAFVRVRQGLTDDWAAVEAALLEIEGEEALGGRYDEQLRRASASLRSAGSGRSQTIDADREPGAGGTSGGAFAGALAGAARGSTSNEALNQVKTYAEVVFQSTNLTL